MRTAIVIPARYASSRLPGKPLLRSTGKYLVQHVYEQAQLARCAQQVVIATDDSRIRAAAESFGAPVVMTRTDHPSGSDRVAEVANQIDADVIINLQGDEPLVDPVALDRLADLLVQAPQAEMATLAVPVQSLEQWLSPHCVKVVCDSQGRALYFSRSPIPYVRDTHPDFAGQPAMFLQHLGLYAYRKSALLRLASLPPHPLEQLEKLEQLRALAFGWSIQVGIVRQAGVGVDTFADYERFVATYRLQRQHRRAQAA